MVNCSTPIYTNLLNPQKSRLVRKVPFPKPSWVPMLPGCRWAVMKVRRLEGAVRCGVLASFWIPATWNVTKKTSLSRLADLDDLETARNGCGNRLEILLLEQKRKRRCVEERVDYQVQGRITGEPCLDPTIHQCRNFTPFLNPNYGPCLLL